MPRPEQSKYATEFGDPGAELRVMRAKHRKSQAEWASAAAIDASVLSRAETGKYFPPRDKYLQWTETWGLDPLDEDDLLISAGYVPRIPSRYENDPIFLKVYLGAIQEVFCRRTPIGFIEMLHRLLEQA